MATSYRVQREVSCTEDFETFDEYCIDRLKNGMYSIWEFWQDYSMTSGQTLHKGKVVKREDPDCALEQQGKPGRWRTKEEAVAYYMKWIYPYTNAAKRARRLA